MYRGAPFCWSTFIFPTEEMFAVETVCLKSLQQEKNAFTVRDAVPGGSSGQLQIDGIHLALFSRLRGRCLNSAQASQALFAVRREE